MTVEKPATLTERYLKARKAALENLKQLRSKHATIIGDALIAIGAILTIVCVITFSVTLFSSTDKAQALGNVVGSALGAFGAFLVARWSFVASERDRKRQLYRLASGMFNAVRDRFDALNILANHFIVVSDESPEVRIVKLKPNEFFYEITPIDPTQRAEISRSLPFESQEIAELDRMLAFTVACINTYREGMRNAPTDLSNFQKLADAIEHLETAAMCWQNIVSGCDLVAKDALLFDKFEGEPEAASEIVTAIGSARTRLIAQLNKLGALQT